MLRLDHVVMRTVLDLHVVPVTITVERETIVRPTEIIVVRHPIQRITISEHGLTDSRIQQIITTLPLPVEPDKETQMQIIHAVHNQQPHRKEMGTMTRGTVEHVLASP